MKRIAELEWANYAATLPSARVTPGLDVTLRDDVILTSSRAFPAPDTNHACLLRAEACTADALIEEVTGYFKSKDLSAAVFISPACSPPDLSSRLVDRGYAKLDEEEAWLVVENLPDRSIPSLRAGITVTPIGPAEAGSFAEVFMAAFGMPIDFAPVLAHLLQSSLGASNARHYLAVNEGEPIGTCSLLRYERFGVLGSAGVLPSHRRSGAATNLTVKALTDAREQGVDTVILQTTADAPLERLLRISGFTRAFTRSCYVLSNDFSD